MAAAVTVVMALAEAAPEAEALVWCPFPLAPLVLLPVMGTVPGRWDWEWGRLGVVPTESRCCCLASSVEGAGSRRKVGPYSVLSPLLPPANIAAERRASVPQLVDAAGRRRRPGASHGSCSFPIRIRIPVEYAVKGEILMSDGGGRLTSSSSIASDQLAAGKGFAFHCGISGYIL